jgi:hypothetical protein
LPEAETCAAKVLKNFGMRSCRRYGARRSETSRWSS